MMSKSIDFNDLHQMQGLTAVRKIIEKAINAQIPLCSIVNLNLPNSPNSQDKLVKIIDESNDEFLDPPIMDKIGFHGLMGRVAEKGCENSEADPVAICCYFLARFSATIGKSVYQNIGDYKLFAKPFFIIVGKTAKARKGTSEYFPALIFDLVENNNSSSIKKLRIHKGGLSSGEGLANALKDDPTESDAKKELDSCFTSDKRMLVIESEFASLLGMFKRTGNILSTTLRSMWDGGDLGQLTKKDPIKATNHHCTIIGHITEHELIKNITQIDVSNGFLNRFILMYVNRKKLVPNPTSTDGLVVKELANNLEEVLIFIIENSSQSKPLVLTFDESALNLWCKVYPEISKDSIGVEGDLLARSDTYARMLAMIFALLDKSLYIKVDHIHAALVWVDYWAKSIRYIYKNQSQIIAQEKSYALAEQIYSKIKSSGTGMSRTEISEAFSKHQTSQQLCNAIDKLLTCAPPRLVATQTKTAGAIKTVYTCAN